VNDQDESYRAGTPTCACGERNRQADRRGLLLLFLTAGILLFWRLGWRSLWAAEGRWAEVTREMFATGDFFHPRIGGEPYFDKPLMTYWLRAVFAAVTGTLDELTVRLPSALAGLAAVWATVRIGTRVGSPRVGRVAGWILLTMYAFLFWARTGTADAENLAAITLAVAWYWSRRDRLGFSAMLVFYLIAFIGALTKGLTAVAVPICIVLPDMVVERRWRILLGVRHWAAVGLAVLVYLSPLLYASWTRPQDYSSSGLAMVFQENILRYFQPFDHKAPIYLYLYELPVLLLPWTPLFLLAAAGLAHSRKSLDWRTRWLMWAIAAVFLFFTLSGSRRSYYILPILPLCAVLIAVFVSGTRDAATKRLYQKGLAAQRLLFFGLIGLDLAIPLILTLIRKVSHFQISLQFHVASLVIGMASALVYGRFARFRGMKRSLDGCGGIRPPIAAAVVLLGGYFCWQEGILDRTRTERPFVQELRTSCVTLSPERVAMFPKPNANILFYLHLDEPIRIINSIDDLRHFLESGPAGGVITQSRYASELPEDVLSRLRSGRYLAEQVQPWEPKSSRPEKWMAWFWPQTREPAKNTGERENVNHAN
jgi:4-amino-4-deoxy-L-arabinose transferase-like glycosyltransferase